MVKITSKEIKACLLSYFRFKRNFMYVSTEVGRYNSDVLVSDGKQIIEIEIKTDLQDLKREKHKHKHRIFKELKKDFYFKNEVSYNNGEKQLAKVEKTLKNIITSQSKLHIPHKFLFCVPEYLKDKALEEIEIINPKYGLLICDGSMNNDSIKGCKLAKKLHDYPTEQKILNEIIMRMSSQITNLLLKDCKNKG
jgi:hypothetical protein